MSTVKLTTFSIFKRHGIPGAEGSYIEPLFGSTAARFTKDNKIELLMDSVPFHSESFKSKAPKVGFGCLMLYGIRDSLEEIKFWSAKARQMDAEFASAEFEFAVGNIEVGLTDRKKLKESRGDKLFLNLRRMTSSLQLEILLKFTDYALAEGGGINEKMNRVSQIATRPDFFDKLLKDDKDLAKLDILVVPVADDPEVPGHMRQVAYVKPGADLVSVVQGSDAATIVMPDWMKSRAVAAKLHKQLAVA